MEIQEYSQTEAALAVLGEKYAGVVFDVATTAGMKSAVAGRAELRGYRTALDKTRKEIKAPALLRCQMIDSEAKRITAKLFEYETPIETQIKAEESRKEAQKAAKAVAEQLRVDRIKESLMRIRNYPLAMTGKSAAEIAAEITRLKAKNLSADAYQEFRGNAVKQMMDTIETLTAMRVDAETREAEAERIRLEQTAEATRLAAEREELARLRAEAEARDAELKRIRDAEAARIASEHEAEAEIRREEQRKIDAANAAETGRLQAERDAAAEIDRLQKQAVDELAAKQAEFDKQEREAAERKRIDRELKQMLIDERRDTPEQALRDILELTQDMMGQPNHLSVRVRIAMIAEASL